MAEARVGYWEYSGDPIVLCVATGQRGYRLEGCCLGVLLWGIAWGCYLGVLLRGVVLGGVSL